MLSHSELKQTHSNQRVRGQQGFKPKSVVLTGRCLFSNVGFGDPGSSRLWLPMCPSPTASDLQEGEKHGYFLSPLQECRLHEDSKRN